MFADPQAVTVNGVAKSLVKIDSSGRTGIYRTADGEFKLIVRHDEKNRARRTVELSQEIVASDPFLTDVNRTYVQRAYWVHDAPKTGFTADQKDHLIQALIDYSTDANIDKVLAGES